jgi:hypothetical protein
VPEILREVPVRVVVHLQQDQAELILLDEDALELGGELGMIRKR